MATSFGLTTSPYFSLKHWINRLSGDWAPKSINPSSVVLTAMASVSAAVAFLSSSRSRAISWLLFFPPHEQSVFWPLESGIKDGVWQLLSMRKPTCLTLVEVVASCNWILTSRSPSPWPESSSLRIQLKIEIQIRMHPITTSLVHQNPIPLSSNLTRAKIKTKKRSAQCCRFCQWERDKQA